MAQGYPQPPQYGQNPYAQPQSAPQAYPANPYPPHGQQPQQYQPQPQQYQQPQPQQPYAAHGQAFDAAIAAPIPEECGIIRRLTAILIDFLVAVGPALVVANKAGHVGKHGTPPAGVPWIVSLLATGLVLSFANQVLLPRLTGFSVGKGILALRVIRRRRVMHPNTWRLTRRWLIGFVILLVTWLTEDVDDVEGDLVGVRIVRWKHLREYQQATGRLG